MSTGWWIREVVCPASMREQWTTAGHAPGCRTRRQVEVVMTHPTVAASCSKEHRCPERSDGLIGKFTSPNCRPLLSLRNVLGRSRPGFFCVRIPRGRGENGDPVTELTIYQLKHKTAYLKAIGSLSGRL